MTRTKITGRAWLVIIGLAVVVTAASYLFGGTDHSTDDATALKACHRAVSTQLKSPASNGCRDRSANPSNGLGFHSGFPSWRMSGGSRRGEQYRNSTQDYECQT